MKNHKFIGFFLTTLIAFAGLQIQAEVKSFELPEVSTVNIIKLKNEYLTSFNRADKAWSLFKYGGGSIVGVYLAWSLTNMLGLTGNKQAGNLVMPQGAQPGAFSADERTKLRALLGAPRPGFFSIDTLKSISSNVGFLLLMGVTMSAAQHFMNDLQNYVSSFVFKDVQAFFGGYTSIVTIKNELEKIKSLLDDPVTQSDLDYYLQDIYRLEQLLAKNITTLVAYLLAVSDDLSADKDVSSLKAKAYHIIRYAQPLFKEVEKQLQSAYYEANIDKQKTILKKAVDISLNEISRLVHDVGSFDMVVRMQ